MGWVLPAALGAGTMLMATAQVSQGLSNKDAYNYQAALAKEQAKYTKKRAALEIWLSEEEKRRIIGRQRVLAGASGGAVDTGTNLSILQDTIRSAAIDQYLIRHGANIDEKLLKAEAGRLKDQGDQMLLSGLIGGGTTLLNTATQWDWRRTNPKIYIPKSTTKKKTASITNPFLRRSAGIY